MVTSLPLLRGTTTLEAALASINDMILEISYSQNKKDFFFNLFNHRSDNEALVVRHLDLSTTEVCRIGKVERWMCGNFDMCIPVYVDAWIRCPGNRVLIISPLPYKLGGSQYPGNVEEKLRCEAATFVWIKDHCPDIHIPYLWGFGFPCGQSVGSLK